MLNFYSRYKNLVSTYCDGQREVIVGIPFCTSLPACSNDGPNFLGFQNIVAMLNQNCWLKVYLVTTNHNLKLKTYTNTLRGKIDILARCAAQSEPEFVSLHLADIEFSPHGFGLVGRRHEISNEVSNLIETCQFDAKRFVLERKIFFQL